MFLPCDLSLDPCVSLAHTWLTQASLVAQLVKNPPAKQETAVQFLDQKGYPFQYSQMVKNPPAVRETWVQSLDWENPLEKGTATHCPNPNS